jgi:dTDP-4-amino-4,6-dideoxygalactose transaminase
MSGPQKAVAVPALNLQAQYATIRDEIEPVVKRVIESQMFILGSEVEALEVEIAKYCEVERGVGCASGTDALILPLMAAGVGAGDEVITTPYSFFATAGSIWRTGARPVFVDIDPETYNIDVTRIEKAITPRTRAIIPVHLYGQTAEMDPILELGSRRGLHIIEDAAQAIGARYNGRMAGSMGDVGALSFYPSKNLGCFGDGGLMTTNDPVLGRSLARLRVHGMEPKYYHHEVGFNSRLDSLQAAVLRVKLRHLDRWTELRREVAERYHDLFEIEGLTDRVQLPRERSGFFHVYNQYVIRVPATMRDPLREHLTSRQIGSEIYYPIPLHLQTCFASLGHKPGDFPISEAAARETLALPIYPEITDEQQRFVVGAIRQFLDTNAHGHLAATERAA